MPCHATAQSVAAVNAPSNARDRAFVRIVSTSMSACRRRFSAFIAFVSGGHSAGDVEHDRVTLPVLHELIFPEMAEECLLDVIDARSEERRVGKECRSRW